MSDFNDIGISRELDWPRIKKLLTIGLFASVLHLAGDLILGSGAKVIPENPTARRTEQAAAAEQAGKRLEKR